VTVFVVIDPLFQRHNPGPGHPERPERVQALLEMMESFPWRGQVQPVELRAGQWGQAAWVHTPDYLGRLRQVAGTAAQLDADTRTSPGSVETALLAAGSTLAMLEKMQGSGQAGFALVRPPGHHAESNRAMGFCLLNNVAIAAEWALREGGARRVAIVDFDVHHGNGTQFSFYDRSDVLYISSHQFPFYPGTGAFSETGTGPGEGFTVNFPLTRGAGDAMFARVYEGLLPQILEQFGPDWILVSAGYDAHREDPLAQLEVTEDGFARVVQSLQRSARTLCGGRIGYLLEGGYHLQALGRCVSLSLEVILGKATPKTEALPEPEGWAEYLAEFRRAQPKWKV
jgi:acetoin utilization deacetylase AcuC-like enzyme